jgi:1,2-dihydroxy-3-keto-5-methylthiopentene dioxygenase
MTISAWYMDEDTESDQVMHANSMVIPDFRGRILINSLTYIQRLPHKPEPLMEVSKDKLVSLGVLFWEGLTGVDDPRVEEIKAERGYSYSDVITCSPEKLPGYETKILSFFEEHIHTDEEIRYCVDGSGYFDIRDEEDR